MDGKIYYQPAEAATHCQCPVCKGVFTPQEGEWPHLVAKGRAICEDCESRLVAGEDFLLDNTEALVAALGDVSRGARYAVL
jgi:hypothetical protein